MAEEATVRAPKPRGAVDSVTATVGNKPIKVKTHG